MGGMKSFLNFQTLKKRGLITTTCRGTKLSYPFQDYKEIPFWTSSMSFHAS